MSGTDNPKETLQKAMGLIDAREKLYGNAEINFDRIASIVSVILNRSVTRYEVAAFLFATKIGRIPEDRKYADSYDDGINYLAFMKQFREDA